MILMKGLTIVEGETRVCKDCGEIKSIEAFPIQTARTGQRRRNCHPCYIAYIKAWNRRNPWSNGPSAKGAQRRALAVAASLVRRDFLARATQGCETCRSPLAPTSLNLVQVNPIRLGAAERLSEAIKRLKNDAVRDQIFAQCLKVECCDCMERRRHKVLKMLPSHLTLASLDEKASLPDWARIKPRVAYGQRKLEALQKKP